MDEYVPNPASPTLKCVESYDLTPTNNVSNEYSFERRIIQETPTSSNNNQSSLEWLPLKKAPNYKLKWKKLLSASKGEIERSPKASEETKSTKNIVKNYGNAIASFACSKLAIPYLTDFLKNESIKTDQFQEYISNQKRSLCNIYNLRHLLQESELDSKEEKVKKIVFKKIAEVFIKYFSVNWIFNSRLKHREAHLRFRGKMLRRIQKPELFTYMNEKV